MHRDKNNSGIANLDLGWRKARIWLFFILLQSIGIRFFKFQGVLLGLVLCLTMIPGLRISRGQALAALVGGSILMTLSLRGVSDFTFIAYFLLVLLVALFYTCHVQDNWHNVEFDLYHITFALSVHGLISYILYLLIPGLFSYAPDATFPYRFFAVFLIALKESDPVRATGLCWEPGLFQYVANISLFLGAKHNKPLWMLALSVMAVVAAYSTSGYLIILIIFIYILGSGNKSAIKGILFLTPILVAGLIRAYFISSDVFDKLDGTNTSGLIRMRDIEIGWELIGRNPLVGHGIDFFLQIFKDTNLEYLATYRFSVEFLTLDGIGSGGYTNGLLAVFATYGVIVGLFLYWAMSRTPIVQGNLADKVVFVLISMVTFMGEPITYTTWFYLLVISGIFVRKYYK